jgi:hypothetical protein
MNNPKTFISYAWESEEAKEWVKKLAIELRNDGIDAKLDQGSCSWRSNVPFYGEVRSRK